MTSELCREQVDGLEVERFIREEGQIRAEERQQCTEDARSKELSKHSDDSLDDIDL